MFSLKTIIPLILLSISFSAFSQTCDSSDNRKAIDQLDCFCQPDDRAPTVEKLKDLGQLKKIFNLEDPSNCESAVLMSMAYSQSRNSDSEISNKLRSLNFSKEQIDSILTKASKRYKLASFLDSRECYPEQGTLTITLISFGGKKKKKKEETKLPAECVELNQLDTKERAIITSVKGAALISKMLKISSFNSRLKQIDEAIELRDRFPEERIIRCSVFSTSFGPIRECAESNADDEKIANCLSLGMSSSGGLKCLSTEANSATVSACKLLSLSESGTLKCLEIGPEVSVAKGCAALSLSESSGLKCLVLQPNLAVVNSCKSLSLSDSGTMKCLAMVPSANVVSACRALGLSESGTFTCLEMKPERDIAISCLGLGLSQSGTLECLEIKPTSAKTHGCGSLSLSQSGTLECLNSNATLEKIQACGREVMSQSQTLECINK